MATASVHALAGSGGTARSAPAPSSARLDVWLSPELSTSLEKADCEVDDDRSYRYELPIVKMVERREYCGSVFLGSYEIEVDDMTDDAAILSLAMEVASMYLPKHWKLTAEGDAPTGTDFSMTDCTCYLYSHREHHHEIVESEFRSPTVVRSASDVYRLRVTFPVQQRSRDGSMDVRVVNTHEFPELQCIC